MNEPDTLAKDTNAPIPKHARSQSQCGELSFTELYDQNANRVFQYLYSLVRNVADAEDLTSQTFMSAFEHQGRLQDLTRFTPWIIRIARNKAFDHFRRARRHPTVELNDELDRKIIIGSGISTADQESLHVLSALISSLGEREQEYLSLRLVADLPFAEIAAILNEPETRIKKKYYRLLERLQAQAEE